jgi:hypothetical protein
MSETQFLLLHPDKRKTEMEDTRKEKLFRNYVFLVVSEQGNRRHYRELEKATREATDHAHGVLRGVRDEARPSATGNAADPRNGWRY